jgi:hypothetical protein
MLVSDVCWLGLSCSRLVVRFEDSVLLVIRNGRKSRTGVHTPYSYFQSWAAGRFPRVAAPQIRASPRSRSVGRGGADLGTDRAPDPPTGRYAGPHIDVTSVTTDCHYM